MTEWWDGFDVGFLFALAVGGLFLISVFRLRRRR